MQVSITQHDSNAESPWYLQLLRNLAGAANLKTKISQMFAGEHLNVTEDRAVLHPALRAPRDEVSRIMTATCSLLHVGSRLLCTQCSSIVSCAGH